MEGLESCGKEGAMWCVMGDVVWEGAMWEVEYFVMWEGACGVGWRVWCDVGGKVWLIYECEVVIKIPDINDSYLY